MKKLLTAILILSAFLILCTYAGGQTPNGPVFTITLEQKGAADGETMTKEVEAKYWPCTMWNSGYYGGLSLTEQSVLGAQVKATPEGLLSARGSIAGMKPGEVLLFYVREKSGSGKAGDCSNEVTTIGDGIFRCIIREGDDVTTHITGDPANEKYSKTFGPGSNTNALIKRTPEGAILTFTEPSLEGEGYCDFFGLFEGNNVPEDWPEVITFTFTNDDLKNWPSLLKINDRTLNGPEDGSLHVRATLHGGSVSYEKAEVTLAGCSELSGGDQSVVTASGKPEGGSYEFRVEPSDLLSVDASGASATLSGSRPGRGTLYVEYTAPDGAKAQATKPASMVRIYNYNGGEAIPQIPLYDINGNKTSGKLTIPYSSEPDEAQELVDFVSGNPSVFSVVASADNLDLQGVNLGKATLEARDNCGNTTGPTVEVEVVNCDKETVEALERMREAAMENLQQANEELQRVANSEEFEKARDEIVESTVELLAKSALTIIGSGETHGVVETAVEIAEAGESVSEMVASTTEEEFDERTLSATLKALGTGVTKALVGAMGVHEAAKKFGDNLGQILYHESALKGVMENFEKAYKDLEEITRKQQICKGDKTEPQKQEEPKADQPPKPPEPTPPTEPKPKTDTPPAKEQPTEEPTKPEPGDEEPPIPPTPPTGEPRQVGLPYSPDECGCNNSKGLTVSSEGFEAIGTGMKNLGDCVDKFNTVSLADYQQALQEMSELSDSLSVAANSGPSVFQVKAREAKPRLDSIVLRAKSYDEAGKTFLKQVEKCPESVSSGMDVLKSALTVTIDSITTKY